MTDREYRNYANTRFRGKYNLRGKAQNGLSRQYGKLKNIRDLEKLMAYMVKESLEFDKNVFTNLNKQKLKKLKEELSHSKSYYDADKLYINYLKNNDIGKVEFNERYVTIEQLAKIWLKETNTRLPSRDTLIYYTYKAGKIRTDDYIYYKYGDESYNHITY